MTYLLDINLLIALCDPNHPHHDLAHRWFGSLSPRHWATCPLTENGFVRITGQSTYIHWKRTPSEQIDMLQRFCSAPGHEFWSDDLSILDSSVWVSQDRVQSGELTDVYLLALAVKNKSKFATLDQSIPYSAIKGGREALFVLPR